MNDPRLIVAALATYVGALAATMFVRTVLAGPPGWQFVAGLGIWGAVLGVQAFRHRNDPGTGRVDSRQLFTWRSARSWRDGWPGTIILMATLFLTFLAEQLAPDAWPLIAIGLIVPGLLIAVQMVSHRPADEAPEPI